MDEEKKKRSILGSRLLIDPPERSNSVSGNEIENMSLLLGRINELIEYNEEASNFALELSQGNLDAEPPDKSNFMAASFKELHAQLSTLAWSMEQLASGYMVSQLYYSGRLFQSFNKVVQMVATLSNKVQDDELPTGKSAVTSWRYHQILSALNSLRIMVFEITEDGRILYANRPAKEYAGDITEFSSHAYGDALIDYLASFYPVEAMAKSDFPVYKELYDEKSFTWYKITSDRSAFIDGSKGYLHVVDDISEWKKKEHELRHTAITDPLTKTYNRRVGIQALEETLSSKSGTKVTHCAAFIDVDELKTINDTFSHAEGDRAIQTIAKVLLSSIRKGDIVCRYGGDEFMIVFNRCNKESAQLVIRRMYEKLDTINTKEGFLFPLSFSYGLIEVVPGEALDVPDLIVRMDRLMYEDKRKRKKRKEGIEEND